MSDTITKGKCCHDCSNHLEEPPEFLKIIFARIMIARFCQKVNDTLNHDRIKPSNHASNNMLAATITTAAKVTPTTVEVFIGQAARAPEGISTTSGSLLSSN
jgi:hypothetical protein